MIIIVLDFQDVIRQAGKRVQTFAFRHDIVADTHMKAAYIGERGSFARKLGKFCI